MKKSRMVDIPKKYPFCNAIGHTPPMHLYIPPGKIYIHVCQSCGKESRIIGSPIHYIYGKKETNFINYI